MSRAVNPVLAGAVGFSATASLGPTSGQGVCLTDTDSTSKCLVSCHLLISDATPLNRWKAFCVKPCRAVKGRVQRLLSGGRPTTALGALSTLHISSLAQPESLAVTLDAKAVGRICEAISRRTVVEGQIERLIKSRGDLKLVRALAMNEYAARTVHGLKSVCAARSSSRPKAGLPPFSGHKKKRPSEGAKGEHLLRKSRTAQR